MQSPATLINVLDDCIEVVLSYLDKSSIMEMMVVCKTLNRTISSIIDTPRVVPVSNINIYKIVYNEKINIERLLKVSPVEIKVFDVDTITCNRVIDNIHREQKKFLSIDVRPRTPIINIKTIDKLSGVNKLHINSALIGNITVPEVDTFILRLCTNINIESIYARHIKIISCTFALDASFKAFTVAHIESLTITSSSQVEDVSVFAHIKHINLSCCGNLRNIHMLKNAHTLDLSDTNVIDVSALGRVHTLNLSNTNVKDVSMLGNVKDLNLYNCASIEHGVIVCDMHTLTCSSIVSIQEHSLNGNIQNLSWMTWETYRSRVDATIFAGIQEVKLSQMSVKNAHMFNNTKVLSIYNCTFLKPLSAGVFANTRELYLSRSTISDVSMLGHLFKLCLSHCENVIDVSALGNVYYLDISWTNVRDGSKLKNVKILNIAGTKIRDVSAYKRAKVVDVSYCEIRDLSPLKNVKVIFAQSCETETDINNWDNVED